MSIGKAWSHVWRYLALVLGLMALNILARGILPQPAIFASMRVPANPASSFGALLFVYSLYAMLLQFIAVHSKTGGWRLYLALVSLFAGIGSFMLQIETLFFGQAFPGLPPKDILLLVLSSVFVGLLFSALVMTVTSRWKKTKAAIPGLAAEFRSKWIVVVIGMVVYPFIYFIFGNFVAYGNHYAVEFYKNTVITQNTLGMISFQVLRGALWAALSLLVINVLEKKEHVTAVLAGGLPLFSGLALIFENPVMPEAVRYAHGFELTSSMTLFGLILGLAFASRMGRAEGR